MTESNAKRTAARELAQLPQVPRYRRRCHAGSSRRHPPLQRSPMPRVGSFGTSWPTFAGRLVDAYGRASFQNSSSDTTLRRLGLSFLSPSGYHSWRRSVAWARSNAEE